MACTKQHSPGTVSSRGHVAAARHVHRRQRSVSRIIPTLVAVGLLLAGCGQPGPGAASPAATTPVPQATSTSATPVQTVDQSVPLRQEGAFYELRTPFEDNDVYPGPLVRKCRTNHEVRIKSVGTNRFSATFSANGAQVGPAREFRRHPFNASLMVGGAGISQNRCSIGAIVDGQSGDPNYKITLLYSNNGNPLSPDGTNTYPKLHQAGGILYVEPRIWFSPDDTVSMIIAAAPESGGRSNMQAHFLDGISGKTVKVVHFRWPQATTEITPYAAKLDNSSGISQIVFSLEGVELYRGDIP